MLWLFKSKSERACDEIKVFESRLNKSLAPLLQKPEKPIAGNGALMSMAVNMGLYFVALRKPKILEKVAVAILSDSASAFATVVAIGSKGKVKVEDAANTILHEMRSTQNAYFSALDKSGTNPEEALQGCLDIFLKSSGGWAFKGEVERAQAVALLGTELQNLMQRFRRLL